MSVINEDNLIAVVAVAGSMLIVIVSIIFSSVRSMVVGREREQTKRELAAYVAEGSLDPDKAIAMINAGKTSSEEKDGKEKCC